MAGKIWIGTSGWHYEHWRGPFYPLETRTADMLAFYARSFSTVELNNSFYRLPSRETFAAWRRQTPPGFLFSVKASRFITHMKKLTDPKNPMKLLLERAAPLGRKLGPILFQLPPGWKLNIDRFRSFLQGLPPRRRYFFEFRNETWFSGEVIRALEKRGAGFCIYQIAGRSSPLVVTGPAAYVRLHGPTEKAYQGGYSDADLRSWATRALRWRRQGKDVYIYFDNDQAGHAVNDARRLLNILASSDRALSVAKRRLETENALR